VLEAKEGLSDLYAYMFYLVVLSIKEDWLILSMYISMH